MFSHPRKKFLNSSSLLLQKHITTNYALKTSMPNQEEMAIYKEG